MNITDIYEMIQIIKNSNLENLNIDNKKVKLTLNKILKFIASITTEYSNEIEILTNSNVRFCDYYDQSLLHGNDIIKYFENTYNGKNKDSLVNVFSLYVILKNSQDIIYNYDLFDNAEELFDFFNYNNYFEDILINIDYLQEKKLANENTELSFLTQNKYKILFTGFSENDINNLEKSTKKALLKKLAGELTTSDYITLSESIDHVKEAYKFPIARIQFADDYRIAYIRKDNITAIIGVTLKTGKDSDYTRYDSIAKKRNQIYEEINLFLNGLLPNDSQHFKVIEQLSEFQKKISESKIIKNK